MYRIMLDETLGNYQLKGHSIKDKEAMMRQFGKQRIGLYLLALVLIIAIPAGVLAQLGDEDEPRPSVPISGDPDMYAEVVDLDEEAGQTDFLLAEAPNTITTKAT